MRLAALLVSALVLAGEPGLAGTREAAQILDQYYVPTRYPNGLPGGTPSQVFTQRQATEALGHARERIHRARAAIGASDP